MKAREWILSALALVAVALPAHAIPAHTFHTSLMRMEYNSEKRSLEVAVQVFAHDLENILTKRSGKKIRLDRTPNAPQLTLAYLNETVNLKNRDGELKTFSWVGMEAQADAVWVYIETAMPEGLDGATLRNRIFFDLLRDQVNLVHLKFEGKKSDLAFKPGDDFKAVGQ